MQPNHNNKPAKRQGKRTHPTKNLPSFQKDMSDCESWEGLANVKRLRVP